MADFVASNEADIHFMSRALSLAAQAGQIGEVPVGALLVWNGAVIAEAFNDKETSLTPTGHAELKVIEKAAQVLKRWRLTDCELYVTLEPCVMCAGAIIQARLKRVIYGARDPKGGAVHSLYEILTDPRLNHRVQVTDGVLGAECAKILTDFFRLRRELKRD